ncbi:ADP-ribosylation factor-like protein 13A isoform X1 [Gadus macrocephalus]|uniref:ADP-ribosylation factor-like protein 13A isoform X1 n=1 Tax=Gadus macrocephalus TaxID=80720 RepID=UPI0028CB7F68|nr:ADP-ribosylation factor-like protein 13A isoform X1 [Gadus macrocephalus]
MDIDLLYRLQRRWWPLCSPGPPHPNMFNLMSNCYSWLSKLQEPIRKVTILVVGLDKAGKTSSVRGMLRVPLGLNTSPTHGCVRSELRVDNYLVSLLDVGGAPESRAVWREVYGDVHGIIFVVDSSDRQRIKEVKDVLSEMLKQPRVAGKPILVLANKQDKVNALLGSELIEVLSLENLVNQSRSLCHIEPCSASTDLRRWADKKTLRGLQWLLRAVCLDYPELCARVAQDRRRPLAAPGDADKPRRAEKGRRKKTKEERLPSSQSDLRQEHRPKEKEKMLKSGGKMQPIRNMLKKENTLKKKLKRSKKKQVKIEDDMETQLREEPQQNDEHESSEEGQEASGQKEKARSPLIPPKKEKGKLRRKKKVNEDKPIQDVPQSPEENEELSTTEETRKKKKKKKKVVKVKRKNKINTEDTPADALSSGHPQVDLSATLDLYRKAILTMKERQDLG